MAKKKNKDKLEEYIIEADRREIVQIYYNYAMLDYEAGLDIKYIEEQLMIAESEELYLVCAGIKKAIDQIKKYSIKN